MKLRTLAVTLITLFSASFNAYATTDNTSNWHTYTNKAYDFSISFPSDLKATKTFSRAYFLRNTWSMYDYATSKNNSNQHSIIEIHIQNTQGKTTDNQAYYYQAYVRVGASTDPKDIAGCDNSKATVPPDQTQFTTVINNQVFNMADFSDAGMSQYNSGTSYSHLYKGKCYRIEYVETGTNSRNIPAFAKTVDKNQRLAKDIIQSFKFLGKDNSSSLQLLGKDFAAVTDTTDFNVDGIQKLLPDYQVAAKEFKTENMPSNAMTISKKDKKIVTLFASPDNPNVILCGATTDNAIGAPLNVKIGDTFTSVYPTHDVKNCQPGLEEMSGRVICEAANAATIFYVFSGKHSVDGKIPPVDTLSTWTVDQITWLPDLANVKLLGQYCRVDK